MDSLPLLIFNKGITTQRISEVRFNFKLFYN